MEEKESKSKKWSDYEEEVYQECKLHYRNSKVEKNVKIRGKLSGRLRQIDVFIQDDYKTVIVDCKYYKHKVDIKEVESFIGMLSDLGADYGILITEEGYSKSALERAYNNPTHLELDIYSLKEFKDIFQGYTGIPYAGKNAAICLAPFGWCIDANRREEAICFLYQKGLTFEEALDQAEFAYINFWDKEISDYDIDKLDTYQTINEIKERPYNSISYLYPLLHRSEPNKIRIVEFKDNLVEITGFIEFDDYIFFCVCICHSNTRKRNTRKIIELLENTVSAHIEINNKVT